MTGVNADGALALDDLTQDEIAAVVASERDPHGMVAVVLRPHAVHQVGTSDKGHLVLTLSAVSTGPVIKTSRILDSSGANQALRDVELEPVAVRVLMRRKHVTALPQDDGGESDADPTI